MECLLAYVFVICLQWHPMYSKAVETRSSIPQQACEDSAERFSRPDYCLHGQHMGWCETKPYFRWQHCRKTCLVCGVEVDAGEASDNGTQNQNTDCQDGQADVYFLLDTSTSVWPVHFSTYSLPFVRRLVDRLGNISPTGNRVGVVSFSDEVELAFDLSSYSDVTSLQTALRPDDQGGRVPYLSGETDTGAAIDYVTGLFRKTKESRATQILVIVTDGKSQSPVDTAVAAQAARGAGIYVFAVAVGDTVDFSEMFDIASNPDKDFVFHVDNFDTLHSIIDLLGSKMCDVIPLKTATTQATASTTYSSSSTPSTTSRHSTSSSTSTTTMRPTETTTEIPTSTTTTKPPFIGIPPV